MNLATEFSKSLQANREKPAIFWGEETISYGRVASEADWLAGQLVRQHGINPGDRVAIWLKNCPEFVSVLFGILRAGAVVVPINNFQKPLNDIHLVLVVIVVPRLQRKQNIFSHG